MEAVPMGLFNREPKSLRKLRQELEMARLSCGLHDKMPEANQAFAEQAIPAGLRRAAAAANADGQGVAAGSIIEEARTVRPQATSGLSWDALMDAAVGGLGVGS
jgi:hypothetical protein